jgi:hypothetical protein
MRVLLNVDFETQKSNEVIRAGRMGETLQRSLADLKPEAACAYPLNGRRGMTTVIDAPDGATLPSLAEPFWLELNAHVEAVPCMGGDERAEGLSRLG